MSLSSLNPPDWASEFWSCWQVCDFEKLNELWAHRPEEAYRHLDQSPERWSSALMFNHMALEWMWFLINSQKSDSSSVSSPQKEILGWLEEVEHDPAVYRSLQTWWSSSLTQSEVVFLLMGAAREYPVIEHILERWTRFGWKWFDPTEEKKTLLPSHFSRIFLPDNASFEQATEQLKGTCFGRWFWARMEHDPERLKEALELEDIHQETPWEHSNKTWSRFKDDVHALLEQNIIERSLDDVDVQKTTKGIFKPRL